MLFFDGLFFFFLAALATTLLVVRQARARVWILTVASYTFYAAWDWRFAFLILFSTCVDWFAAKYMVGAAPRRRKHLLVLSLLTNLGALAIFKYLDFGIGTLNAMLGVNIHLLELTLPVGISFFTFQSMSYTIDVYRGKLRDQRFIDFALFVSFFPQLVAGPIIRATDFLPQISKTLRSLRDRVLEAIPLFVLGLFKKVVVADNLSLIVDKVYANPEAFSSLHRAEATLAFAAQIYCDFSGYTDMALALCIAFGFRFPLNFRSPYLSRGPQEFWRRWHISLSTWLRDYLYKPLGGSHKGRARTYAALMATMVLGGLWHGAAVTFILWGVFHGTILVVERLVRNRIPEKIRKLLTPLTWAMFFALTLLGWVIFRSDSMAHLGAMLDGIWWPRGKKPIGGALVGMCWTFLAVEHIAGEFLRRKTHRPVWWPYLAFFVSGLLLAAVLLLRPIQNIPFIYFQF